MPLLHPVSSRSETSLLSNPSIAHPDLLSATKQLDACLSLLSDGYLIKQFQTGSARNSFLLDVHRCIEDESNHCKYDIELLDNHLQLAGSKGLYKRVVLGVKRRTEAKVQLIPKTLAPYEERVAWCRFMTEELVMIVRGQEDSNASAMRTLRSQELRLRRRIENLHFDLQIHAATKPSANDCLVLMQEAHNLELDHDRLRAEANRLFDTIGRPRWPKQEIDDVNDMLPQLMEKNVGRKLWQELRRSEEMHRQVVIDMAELIRSTAR